MNANVEKVWGDEPAGHSLGRPGHQRVRIRTLARVRRAWELWAWRLSASGCAALARMLDLVGATLAGVLLTPVMLLTWLAILWEDGGPVIYVQQRVGKDGKLFSLFKFRSMVLDAERRQAQLAAHNESGTGVLFKMRRDPRITRVGAIIRKLSIDELPQLLNVLRGDMSLVGPRPALPAEVARYAQAQRARLSVRPGITCLWQIGGRSDIDFDGQLQLDMRYIRERSFWNDISILLRTIPAVLTARGAY